MTLRPRVAALLAGAAAPVVAAMVVWWLQCRCTASPYPLPPLCPNSPLPLPQASLVPLGLARPLPLCQVPANHYRHPYHYHLKPCQEPEADADLHFAPVLSRFQQQCLEADEVIGNLEASPSPNLPLPTGPGLTWSLNG